MATICFGFRLSLKRAAEEAVSEDGTTLHRFIVAALADRVASLRTRTYFSQRAGRADLAAFDRIMNRPATVPSFPVDE